MANLDLSYLIKSIESDSERSRFCAVDNGNGDLVVRAASPRALQQYRKMGFGGTQGIVGRFVSDIYLNSAKYLYHSDPDIADEFVLQQQETWDRIQYGSSPLRTLHVFERDDRYQKINLTFLKFKNLWPREDAYFVEVQIDTIFKPEYLRLKALNELLVPRPRRIA